MIRLRNIFTLIFLSIVFIGCDQVTKKLAKKHLIGQPTRSYFYDSFRLAYAENTGAFLSMGDDWSATTSFWVFTIFPLLVLSGLFVLVAKKINQLPAWELLALLLIFSGGIGNLIDRILYDRHVTDFLNVGISSLRTGIFNIADLYVTTGAIMMLVGALKKRNASRP
jgi:signal peptidase II